MGARIAAELGPHEHVTPIDLRMVHGTQQLREITLTQLQHRKTNALEAGWSALFAERQIVAALMNEDIDDGGTLVDGEQALDPLHRPLAQFDSHQRSHARESTSVGLMNSDVRHIEAFQMIGTIESVDRMDLAV